MDEDDDDVHRAGSFVAWRDTQPRWSMKQAALHNRRRLQILRYAYHNQMWGYDGSVEREHERDT